MSGWKRARAGEEISPTTPERMSKVTKGKRTPRIQKVRYVDWPFPPDSNIDAYLVLWANIGGDDWYIAAETLAERIGDHEWLSRHCKTKHTWKGCYAYKTLDAETKKRKFSGQYCWTITNSANVQVTFQIGAVGGLPTKPPTILTTDQGHDFYLLVESCFPYSL